MNELSQGQIYYLNKQRRRRKIVRFSRAAILLEIGRASCRERV